LFGFIFKPASIADHRPDGTEDGNIRAHSHAASEGMVLSPLVDSASGWRAFYSPSSPEARRAAVKSRRISARERAGLGLQAGRRGVAFFRMSGSGQTDLNSTEFTSLEESGR